MTLKNDEQQNALMEVAKRKAKQQVRKRALKLGKKTAKALGKAAIQLGKTAVTGGLKAAVGVLLSALAPILLIGGFVVGVVLIVYFSVTLLFGGSNALEGEAGKLQQYMIEASEATVDQSRPEQIPYQVPHGLIAAIMNLYESEKRGETTEFAIAIVASALRPIFTYETKPGYTETITTTCGENGCTTTNSTTEFEQEFLVHVIAWNGIMEAEIIPYTGEWETYTYSNTVTTTDAEGNEYSYVETTTVQSRVHAHITDERFTEDYAHFEVVMMAKPFSYEEMDLSLIEALYVSTGGIMNYTAMKQGISLGDYGLEMNVIPGAGVPAEYMQYYLSAQQKYGVDWFYLAAIHYVETRFSTHPTMISSVGAEGHMQIMPCTFYGWSYPGCAGSNGYVKIADVHKEKISIIKQYGGYGIDADGNGKASPWEIADAIHTAAYILAKNGFKSNVDKALYAYNHSESYVQEVKQKALEFKEAATYEAGYKDGVTGKLPPSDVKNGFIQPTTGTITSSWGDRYINGQPDFHPALDIANAVGTPILAIADGTIKSSESFCPKVGYYGSTCGGGWGNYIWIQHEVNGVKYDAVYAHLSNLMYSKVGTKIKQGQIIALMGNSGSSTGPHLHLELHVGYRNKYKNVVNPLLYIPFN